MKLEYEAQHAAAAAAGNNCTLSQRIQKINNLQDNHKNWTPTKASKKHCQLSSSILWIVSCTFQFSFTLFAKPKSSVVAVVVVAFCYSFIIEK